MVSPAEVPMGRPTRVSFEVVDPRTGKRVASPAFLGDVKENHRRGGRREGRANAGPRWHVLHEVRFDKEGRQSVVAELKSERV